MPTIMCVCVCIIISGRPTVCASVHAKTSMPSVCVSVSQIVSHSVSSCVCVSAVAERNSLQGKKWRRAKGGREEKRQGWWDGDDDDDDDVAEGGTGGLDYDDTSASAALSALYYKCICMTTKYTYKHHNRTLVHNVHTAVSKMFRIYSILCNKNLFLICTDQ